MRRARLWWLALALAGCGSHPTSLALSVSVGPGLPTPDSLRISLFGQGRVGAPIGVPLASAGRTLPGTVVLGPLDPPPPGFRLVVDGIVGGATVEQAAAPVALAAGVQNRAALTLGAPLADGDGDGVPDVVDDCPALADPDQTCPATDGGDLGAPADLGLDGGAADGGAPACPPGALFCDDFESGDASRWSGKTQSGVLATIAVDTVRPLHGLYSADARSLASALDLGLSAGQTATLDETILSTSLPNALWARTYVYFAQAPATSEQVLAFSAGGTLGQEVGVGSSGGWALYEGGTLNSQAAGTPVPSGRWVCLELGVDLTNNQATLLADGQMLFRVKLRQPAVPTGLQVGLIKVPTSSRVFFDDVALASSRVGCE